jgi:hypothetical protein
VAQTQGETGGFYLGASGGWLRGTDMNGDAIDQAFAAQDLAVRTTSVDNGRHRLEGVCGIPVRSALGRRRRLYGPRPI